MFSHKIIGRSFLILCLVFALILGALIFIARERTNMIIDELTNGRVMDAKQGFDNYLDELTANATARATVLSRQNRLIDAVKEYEAGGFTLTDENYEYIVEILDEFLVGFDFVSITDRNGIALARVDNGERRDSYNQFLPPYGYNLMANPDVQQVFETGEAVSSLSFMLNNTTLVATTLYPLYDYDGETVLGNITCFYDLTIPKYVKAFRDQSGSDVAIFLRQEGEPGQEEQFVQFISSLALSDDSSENVNIAAGSSVIEQIMKGESYVSINEINNVMYGTVFSPLIYRGEIVGMVFNGVDVHNAVEIRTQMNYLIIIVATMGIAATLVFIVVIQRYNQVIRKQMTLQTLMTRISQDFLSANDVDWLVTETFRELGIHMDVSHILLFKAKPDEPLVFACSNEWIDPALKMTTRIGEELIIPQELVKVYASLMGKEKFYISSDDDSDITEVFRSQRIHFNNYLTTVLFLDGQIYAILDFTRASKRRKWSKDDINAASWVSNILTSTFHRKVVEERLVSAKEEAERNDRFKSAFLANVSHEIRTPMNAILGITEIYLQDRDAQANIEEGLGMIYDSGNLLLGIINDILDLSKIEAGRMEIMPDKYNVPNLIYDAVQLCKLRYGSKPIEFVLDIDKQTPMSLIGDELRIRQILNNILSNAFKYTDTGEVKMSVSADQEIITARTATSDVVRYDNITLIIRVSDTGQGMTPEQLDMLFDEFMRFNLEINRTTVGTGLGMSITKRLLDLMDGEIYVESQKGKGSVFTIKLPQLTAGADVCGPEMSQKLNNFQFHSMSLKKKSQVICEYMPYGSVLIVDDVESNLYVAKGMLIPYGLNIETAVSGFEAIDQITSGKSYDVIFMDHMMPRMDGIETVKNLREMGYGGYIIAMTANAIVGQAELFMENGFDGYIAKPVDTRELNTILNEFIRNKKPPEVVNAAREEAREAELLRSLESTESKAASRREKAAREMAEMRQCFVSDAKQAVSVLEKEHENLNKGEEPDVDTYRVSVHGMKSALKNIGERALSDLAYELEQAALTGDLETMRVKTLDLTNALKSIVERLA